MMITYYLYFCLLSFFTNLHLQICYPNPKPIYQAQVIQPRNQTMFAPTPTKQTQSRINIQFGEKISEQKTPITMNLAFDIFSQKNQNDRFVLQVLLGNQIADNTLLVVLNSKKGNGVELADKIMTFLKSSKQYLKLNNQGKTQVKAIGKGETCYLFINSEKVSSNFDEFSQLCAQFKEQKSQDPNLAHEIKLEVKSQNDCEYIRKLLDNQGGVRAAFDSLNLNFTFQKTPLVQKILEKIFTQLQLINVLGPLKGFNHLNLSLNFASASEMDKYEKLRVFGKVANKIQTGFLSAIKGEITDEVNFTYFNPTFSFDGKIVTNEVETLLEALFEDSSKSQ